MSFYSDPQKQAIELLLSKKRHDLDHLDREEYIAELYDHETNERPEIKTALEGLPTTKDEIALASKKMKRGKQQSKIKYVWK